MSEGLSYIVQNVKSNKELLLSESIYDFALVVLLNPKEMEDWPDDPKYLQPILMTANQRKSIFQGALIVIFMQLITLYLIFSMFTENDVQIFPSKNF